MKRFNFILLFVICISLNIYSQWNYNVNDIYYDNGNVGIGTTSPSSKLTVKGGFHLQETSDQNLRLSMGFYKSPFVNLEYGFINSLDWSTNPPTAKNLAINSQASNDAWGNVGIGPLVPLQALDIGGRLSVRKGVIQDLDPNNPVSITSTTDLGLYSQRSGYNIRIVSKNAPIQFYTDAGSNLIGGSPTMVVDQYGKVGINTSNPLLPLTVNGPINGTGIQLGLSPTSSENYHLVSYNGYLQLFNGNHLSGTRLVTFRSNGNVGIGVLTYNSDAKLAVDGSIKAKEVVVSLNPYDWNDWPDYVFKEDFKPMPLDEVEKYVKENNHLPEMESAEEIEEKGINLGEMQKNS